MVSGEGFPVDFLYYALDEQPLPGFDRETFLSSQACYRDRSNDLVPPEVWGHTLHFPLAQQVNEGGEKTPRTKESRKKVRSCNPVPRHKRLPQVRAELRQRGKIQRALDELEKLVPDINDHPACHDSKSAKLFKISEHCRRLVAESQHRHVEIASLREEIERLSSKIQEGQACLPAVGIQHVYKSPCLLDKMLDSYVRSRIYHNWKFWMFSLLVRPLFASYNTSVSTATTDQFIQSVCQWTETYLSAYYFRPAVGSLLRDVRTQTPILTEPYRVAQTVTAKFFQGPNA